MSEMSAYKAAKVVNEMLSNDGFDKVLPAQMFYNYTTARINHGKAPLIEVNEDGKITQETLLAWYEKYTEKLVRLAEAKAEKEAEAETVDA